MPAERPDEIVCPQVDEADVLPMALVDGVDPQELDQIANDVFDALGVTALEEQST